MGRQYMACHVHEVWQKRQHETAATGNTAVVATRKEAWDWHGTKLAQGASELADATRGGSAPRLHSELLQALRHRPRLRGMRRRLWRLVGGLAGQQHSADLSWIHRSHRRSRGGGSRRAGGGRGDGGGR